MAVPESPYVAVIGALLLVALVLGIRVLWGIVGDAREIRRKRRAGELAPNADDEEPDRIARDPAEGDGAGDPDGAGDRDAADALDDAGPSATCPECGAANDPAFDYCRRCASSLPPGG
jgi:hypothetical protein